VEVTNATWRIVRSLHVAARLQRRGAVAAPLGMAGLGLLNLAAESDVRPKDAAAELDVPAQSITRAVTELERKGYARRVGDGADGRSYRIQLTDDGRRARRKFQKQLLEQFSRHLEDWEPDEIEKFARQLDRLVTSLTNDVVARPDSTIQRNRWRPET
jgi:DNA-binding MarR family transcriptional regulator